MKRIFRILQAKTKIKAPKNNKKGACLVKILDIIFN